VSLTGTELAAGAQSGTAGATPYGADGKTLDTTNWYYYLFVSTGNAATMVGRIYIADVNGNYSMVQKLVPGGHTPYAMTGRGSTLDIGSYYMSSQNSERRINVSICQMRSYRQYSNDIGWGPFNGDYFEDKVYLNSFSKTAEEEYLRTEEDVGAWGITGYWSLDGTSDGLEVQHNDYSNYGLVLGDDGEQCPASEYTDGPPLL
jgi:hypothetical protein